MKKELLSSTSLVYLPAPPLVPSRGEYGRMTGMYVYGDKAVQHLTDLGRRLGKSMTIARQIEEMMQHMLDEGYTPAQAAAVAGNWQHENQLMDGFIYDAS